MMKIRDREDQLFGRGKSLLIEGRTDDEDGEEDDIGMKMRRDDFVDQRNRRMK